MKQTNFDEYQLLKRYKVAFQTLILFLAIVFINGFIAEQYMWASPSIQALILLIIATAYFVTMCIFKNAYISNKTKNKPLSISVFIILGLLNAGIGIYSLNELGELYILKEGKLQRGVMPVIMGCFFLYIALIALIKYLIDRKRTFDE